MRSVVAVVPDLMDRSRLQGTADVEVRFVAIGDLASVAAEADLVVIDISRPGALDGLAAAGPLGVPVVGFGPHVEEATLAAGAGAGCDRVLPRSRFFARWPDV